MQALLARLRELGKTRTYEQVGLEEQRKLAVDNLRGYVVKSNHFPLNSAQTIYCANVQSQKYWYPPQFFSYRISGRLDVEAMIRAVQELVERHDALRVLLLETSGSYSSQQVQNSPSSERLITCKEIRNATEQQFDKYVQTAFIRDIKDPFDHVCDYPFRFQLLRYSGEHHAFIGAVSRLILDGVGRSMLMHDLWWFYERYARNNPSSWNEITEAKRAKGVLTFAEACRRRAQDRRLSKPTDFWARQAAKFPEPWQFDQALRQTTHTEQGAPYTESLDITATERLKRLAKASGTSPFQWAIVALSAAAFRISDASRIAIHVTMDTRIAPERNTAGAFAVALPLIISRAENPAMLLHEVGTATLRAAAYRNAPAEQIIAMYGAISNRPSDSTIAAIEQHLTGERTTDICGLRIRQGTYSPAVDFKTIGILIYVIYRETGFWVKFSFSRNLFSEGASQKVKVIIQSFLQAAEEGTSWSNAYR